MRNLPDVIDRLLRILLGLPGLVVEALDGPVRVDSTSDLEQVTALVQRTARHPEAYLALEEGLHHVVDAGRVLGWQHRGRTAFAIGGLNAEPSARADLLAAYTRATAARGVRRQLVFPLRLAELPDAGAAGFEAIQVGSEAWVDLRDLTLRGKRFENLRQMRNRARRRGVEVAEVSVGEVRDELAAIHAAWLRGKRPSWRMKLLVGSPSLDRPLDRRYLVARTAERIEGFVTLLPGGDGVWGVDVMCRRPDAVSGTMERLLADAVERLRDEGMRHLSLGSCPMAGVPFDPRRPVLSAAFRVLYSSRLGNRIFGFRRLVAFKDKLAPRWEPVYLAARPHLSVGALYRGCRMWGLY